MIVNGYEVPSAIIKACEERIRSGEQFRASTIENMALENGAPKERCNRIADRLIQWYRKQGRIRLMSKNFWVWVP